MPPDFLPLEVGNLWLYEMTGPDGDPIERLEMEVTDHIILDATSLYLFSRFPLAPDGGFPGPVGIRYDNERREYVHFDGEREGVLFPAVGASADVLETDDGGLPLKVRLGFGGVALTLERGVGITEAVFETDAGRLRASLVGARVAGIVIGEVQPVEPASRFPIADPIDTVAAVSETNPVLELEVLPDADGHRLVLHVRNTASRLLGFDFSTSQSYDFVVTDPITGEERWRWSRRTVFSDVRRSESVRANGEWTFQEVWNHRDNAVDPLPPGRYRVVGVLTSLPPLESPAVVVDLQ